MHQPSIYLSYVKADQSWAEQLTALLAPGGLAIRNPQSALLPNEAFEQFREAILASTLTIVLLGPTTRQSRWVDREIALSTEAREDGPGAGLLGLILPTHEDFARPYYDPENVPIRLHDLIQSEYALLRKWTARPEEILSWLAESERRRLALRPEPSLRAAAEIYRFGWDRSVDETRPSPEAL